MPVTECIAVYIRLSSEDNDVDGSIKAESNSVSAQRMLINEFIKKQDEFTNCPVVEYVDDGYSGTNFNRPGFQRMVEDAKAGRIKSIVIKDFSRFGRDYLEVGNYLEKILPVLGIRIISINDGFDSINSSGFTGGMSVALKNMLNAMYSRDLSRKVRSAMKTHAKNGEYMPAFPKYGYIKDPEDKHHLVIDPEAAEINAIKRESGVEINLIKVDEHHDGYSGDIYERIIEGIKKSALVIADLSYGNRNVHHEIGLAQGMGKKVLLLYKLRDAIDARQEIGSNISMYDQVRFKNQTELRPVLTKKIEQYFEIEKN